MKIKDVRKKYPQYEDLSDLKLIELVRAKFYKDIDEDAFLKKVGVKK